MRKAGQSDGINLIPPFARRKRILVTIRQGTYHLGTPRGSGKISLTSSRICSALAAHMDEECDRFAPGGCIPPASLQSAASVNICVHPPGQNAVHYSEYGHFWAESGHFGL